MNALHKSVEVQALLLLEGQRLEERIHEVRLAAPHPAPEIKTDFGLLNAPPKQPTEQALFSPCSSLYTLVQMLQLDDGKPLRSVWDNKTSVQIRFVAFSRRWDHLVTFWV